MVLKLTRVSCTILGEAWMERKEGDGLRNGSLQLTTAEARDLQREKRTVRWLWRMKGNRDTSREERKVNFRKDALLPPHSDSIRQDVEGEVNIWKSRIIGREARGVSLCQLSGRLHSHSPPRRQQKVQFT